MSELMTTFLACECVSRHVPESDINDLHHIVPKSWGGEDKPTNKIVTCPATHRLAHLLLSTAVRKQRVPTYAELRGYPRRVQWLVKEAIRRFGGLPKDERINTPE